MLIFLGGVARNLGRAIDWRRPAAKRLDSKNRLRKGSQPEKRAGTRDAYRACNYRIPRRGRWVARPVATSSWVCTPAAQV